MFKNLLTKFRNWLFYRKHHFTKEQFKALVNHTNLQESIQPKDISYNEYLRKYF